MEVSLKKNGWHKRLQVWTFGKNAPEFNSLCPFFWTTVFCVFASPFVATFKYLVALPLKYFVLGLDNTFSFLAQAIETLTLYLDVKVCQPMYEQKVSTYVETMSDDDAYSIFRTLYRIYSWHDIPSEGSNPLLREEWYSDKNSKLYKAYKDKFFRWKDKLGDDWHTALVAAGKQYDDRQEELRKLRIAAERAQALKEKQRAKTFKAIAYYTKYLFYLFIGVVGVYVLYFLSLVGLWIYEARASIVQGLSDFAHWVANAAVVSAPYFLGAVGVIALLIPLVIFAGKMLAKCNLFEVSNKPSKVGKFFTKVADGIFSVVDFFVTYAKVAKQDYCPHINWED